MSRKTVAACLTATLVGVLLAAGVPWSPATDQAQARPAAAAEPFRAAPVTWKRCQDPDLRRAGARCGFLIVPLDYADPAGPTIRLAVSRVLHTAGPYRGAAFVNPGGPGGSALRYSLTGGRIPHGVGRTYDWYGMDPRGVGSSVPALSCDPAYVSARHRRPYQPTTAAILDYWLARTTAYATACGSSSASALLPHLRTTDNVADLESLRTAIGQSQVTYYGFSYGTYIGQVWATLHPSSLKAMVLDGVVDPGRVWYSSNLDQDRAFDVVYGRFFAWVARNHRHFGLGRTQRQVAKRFARLHRQLERKPLGRLGAADLEDALLLAGYYNSEWGEVAFGLYALAHGDPRYLRQLVSADRGPQADNNYAVYLATSCTDAPWPQDWSVWAADNAAADRDSPYLAWNNAWYNAPCRTWPAAASAAPPTVDGAAFTGPVLLISEQYDAATPLSGALAVRTRFPTASLIEGRRGTTHAGSLSGVSCVDNAIAALLEKGRLPGRMAGPGPDKTCPGVPLPGARRSQAPRSTPSRRY